MESDFFMLKDKDLLYCCITNGNDRVFWDVRICDGKSDVGECGNQGSQFKSYFSTMYSRVLMKSPLFQPTIDPLGDADCRLK